MRSFGIALIILFACAAAHAQHRRTPQPLPLSRQFFFPPFGRHWGEPSEGIAAALRGTGARIVKKHFVGQEEAWDVDGIIQPNLARTIFYFQTNRLVGIELQYQNAKWSDAQYRSFMNEIKDRIEGRYGQGKLLAYSTTPIGAVTQTVIGYKWSLNNTSLEIFYFSAVDKTNAYRTVSVHYKNY